MATSKGASEASVRRFVLGTSIGDLVTVSLKRGLVAEVDRHGRSFKVVRSREKTPGALYTSRLVGNYKGFGTLHPDEETFVKLNNPLAGYGTVNRSDIQSVDYFTVKSARDVRLLGLF
ncbi:MAG: hypothetical protein AABX70_06680 [Nanoarchaeota archaeon]